MADPGILSFGHHVIPLLSLSRTARGMGGKVQMNAVKTACRAARRIHAPLTMAGRFELGVLPNFPDFFDPAEVGAKPRNHAWETISETMRIQWVIPTRRPDMVSSCLPSTWIGKGFQNVCIGFLADSESGFPEMLGSLIAAPVKCRMLLLTASSPTIDAQAHLKGIDWVVLAGDVTTAASARTIGLACRQVGVPFLYHRTDDRKEPQPASVDAAGENPWPSHPFGNNIDLSQPPLQARSGGSKAGQHPPPPPPPVRLQVMTDSANAVKPPPASSDAEGSQSEALALDFEIVGNDLSNPPVAANSGVPDSPGNGSEADEFRRLDKLLRSSLGAFFSAGRALAEIRNRELWKAGDHPSWAAYCESVGGLSKVHANRLIRAAEMCTRIAEVKPIGFTPVTESQLRPLCRLKTDEDCVRAWTTAFERAGGQPSARQLSEIVAGLMAGEAPLDHPAPRGKRQIIRRFLDELREAIRSKPLKVSRLEGLATALERDLRVKSAAGNTRTES